MTKTSDQFLADAAKLRRKAREAERAEMEALGRWTAGRFGGDAKGASARIKAARQAFEVVPENTETVARGNAASAAHERHLSAAHEDEGNRDVMTSLFTDVGRGSQL